MEVKENLNEEIKTKPQIKDYLQSAYINYAADSYIWAEGLKGAVNALKKTGFVHKLTLIIKIMTLILAIYLVAKLSNSTILFWLILLGLTAVLEVLSIFMEKGIVKLLFGTVYLFYDALLKAHPDFEARGIQWETPLKQEEYKYAAEKDAEAAEYEAKKQVETAEKIRHMQEKMKIKMNHLNMDV